MDQETNPPKRSYTGTIIMFVVLVPVVLYLFYFAVKKNQESPLLAKRCQEKCAAKGFAGYDFKWNVFSGPQCTCLQAP